jgi:hypothetical protein
VWFFAAGAVEALFAAVYLLLIPPDAKNALVGGYSLRRIFLLFLIAAGGLVMAAAAVAAARRRVWAAAVERRIERLLRDGRHHTAWVLAILFAWLVFFLPADRLGAFQAYYERFRPALIWLAFCGLQGCLLYTLAVGGIDLPALRALFTRQKVLLRAGAIALMAFIAIWLVMAVFGFGIRPDDRYWNEAGVPILGLQVLWTASVSLAIGAFLFGEFGGKQTRSRKRLDLWIGLLIWLAAAASWNLVPFERSHFASAPIAPNDAYYPFSDAEIYDTGAQYLLIGQGLNNRESMEKPVYLLFLALLHGVGGQDLLRIAGLQAVFLALLPAFVYFIGVSLGQRTAGLLAGLLLLCKETNAILAVLKIQVAHSRLLMTEMPVALGLALLALVLLEWLRSPSRKPHLALLAGGVFGLTNLLRLNTWVLAPLILLCLIAALKTWRLRLGMGLLFFLGMALSVTPWFFGVRTPDGTPFLLQKINTVLTSRYNIPLPSAPGLDQTEVTPLPSSTAETPAVQATAPPADGPGQVSTPPASTPPGGMARAVDFIPSHFFHNLAMAQLAFPLSLRPDDLAAVLKAPYWANTWDGRLSLGQGLLLLVNLVFLAGGIGTAFAAAGWRGLLPLAFFFLYHAANALGRTSGSRYLVPVDWVLVVYFSSGLVLAFGWTAVGLGTRFSPLQISQPGDGNASFPIWKVVSTAAAIAAIGSSLLWLGDLVPRRYPPQDARATIQSVLPVLNAAGVPSDSALGLLNSGDAVAFRGRGLYPKFFTAGHAEVCPYASWNLLDVGYPHLMLRVIGATYGCVRLPQMQPMHSFPDAADVVVIGCRAPNREIHALALIVETPTQQVYLRDPPANWICPLPVPVCRDDGTCR